MTLEVYGINSIKIKDTKYDIPSIMNITFSLTVATIIPPESGPIIPIILNFKNSFLV